MNNELWRQVLAICRQVLGRGSWDAAESESWCAYTTFSSLTHGVNYWCCGFPDENELLENSTLDGGLWRQEIQYSDLAHLIIPKVFYWEVIDKEKFSSGYKDQDIVLLSREFDKLNIKYRHTELIVEIKLY